MIKIEIITIDERLLQRTYSDENLQIRQVETGNIYSEAVDVIPCRYTYEETDTPIEVNEDASFDDTNS